MIQEILTYLSIGAAIGYVLLSMYKAFQQKKNAGGACSGCTSCSTD